MKIFDIHIIYKLLFLILIIIYMFILIYNKIFYKKKKVGVIGLRHEVNIGNILLKYAISIKLSELGFEPYIIGTHWRNKNITFLKEKTNLIVIKNNFSEIKRNDYDFLIVNSDQTWRKFDDFFYDYGFLKFAENWNIRKIVYGASLGYNYWKLTQNDERIIKKLLNKFKGISVREKGSIKLIKEHLGITPIYVLDPTLLINKKYYLNLIKSYKGKIKIDKKYIFNYSIRKDINIINFINLLRNYTNYKLYNWYLKNSSKIEDFIYGIVKLDAIKKIKLILKS